MSALIMYGFHLVISIEYISQKKQIHGMVFLPLKTLVTYLLFILSLSSLKLVTLIGGTIIIF